MPAALFGVARRRVAYLTGKSRFSTREAYGKARAYLRFRARREEQARFLIFVDEALDGRLGSVQEIFNFGCSAVGNTKPDDFGRMTAEYTSLLKIRVFRDDREIPVSGISPNSFIVSAS